jgi:hypothetical protein
MTIAKMIICIVIGFAIAALHIWRECKWFESLDDEDTMYAMNVMHRNFKDNLDR